MLDVATCLQLCCITSATLVSQEYHKNAQTSRDSEAILQKKYRYFKNPLHFYRNPSVTNSPKTLQLCCASPQNQPSATGIAPFWGRSGALRFAYYSIYIHLYAYQSFVYAFVPLRSISFSAPFPRKANWSRCAVPGTTAPSLKSTKKRPPHKLVQRPLTIQVMLLNYAQGQAITEQPLLPRSA